MGRGSLGRRSFGLCATKSRSSVQAPKKVALNRVQTDFFYLSSSNLLHESSVEL